MTKGRVGVWNGPKKDDVIYEQPLTLNELTNGKKEILGTMTKKEIRIFYKFTLLGQLEFKIMTPITYAGNLKE